MKSSQDLLTLEIPNQDRLIPPVKVAVARLTEGFGLGPQQASGLAGAVAEACKNANRYAFDENDNAVIKVKAQLVGHRLLLAICDQGLPFDGDLLEKSGRGGTGNELMHQFADSVKVKNLGTGGMELVLTKVLPVSPNAQLETEAKDTPKADDLEYRLLGPDDALSISRCTYRTYGYTYLEEVYHPDMVSEGLEHGYLISYGAMTPEGELAGHLAVLKDEPDAPVGELALGMVDPSFRGHGIFQRLLPPVLEQVTKIGMLGLFAETVTVHTITQKGKHVHGWRETGVVLGYIGDRTFKAIEGGEAHARQAIILFYVTLNSCPRQTVYVPEHHHSIAEKIYAENGLDRQFGINAQPQNEAGEVVVESHPERGTANIYVEQWGQDTVAHVGHHLNDLTLKRIDLILLDLPLASPATGANVEAFEEMGFFFAGIVPNLLGEDVLRLQYLNNVKVEIEAIKTYSDFAGELLQYVLKEARL